MTETHQDEPPEVDDAVFDVVRETVAELEMLTARLRSFLGEVDD